MSFLVSANLSAISVFCNLPYWYFIFSIARSNVLTSEWLLIPNSNFVSLMSPSCITATLVPFSPTFSWRISFCTNNLNKPKRFGPTLPDPSNTKTTSIGLWIQPNYKYNMWVYSLDLRWYEVETKRVLKGGGGFWSHFPIDELRENLKGILEKHCKYYSQYRKLEIYIWDLISDFSPTTLQYSTYIAINWNSVSQFRWELYKNVNMRQKSYFICAVSMRKWPSP